MPRHHPTLIGDDGDRGDRHGRRLERSDRARNRRAVRSLQGAPGGASRRPAGRRLASERDVDRQVAEWRSELQLLP